MQKVIVYLLVASSALVVLIKLYRFFFKEKKGCDGCSFSQSIDSSDK